MSRGKNLQEMEVGTAQSKTAVNSGAKSGDPMAKLSANVVAGQSGSWEDLGGPTPEDYKSDDDSAKLKTPVATLQAVKNIVNKGAKAADPMQSLKGAVKEEEEHEEEVIEEEITDEIEEELISEEESEEESEEVIEEDFDIEDDVNALLNSGEEEDLSEEFKDKARTIFESALRSKVSEIRESLEVKYEEKLAESVLEIKEELQERVDSYLEYVAQEWITENQLAIEGGLKEELTESFMTGLKGLFEEHYVSIPEEKYDVLGTMVEKLDEMESKLNEQIGKNISLTKKLSESSAERIFIEVSESLALSQREKLASLAESVEFESEEKYREKLETLRESYFPLKSNTPITTTETLSEGLDASNEYYSDSMNAYLKTLSAVVKN